MHAQFDGVGGQQWNTDSVAGLMQTFLSKYGVYVAAVALVFVGVIYYLSINRRPVARAAPKNAFFVDEETGAESVRPVSDVPPLPGASGKETLVGEYKYS